MKTQKTFTYRVVYRCGHAYTIETRRRVSKTEQTHDQDVASRTLCPRCEEREEKKPDFIIELEQPRMPPNNDVPF